MGKASETSTNEYDFEEFLIEESDNEEPVDELEFEYFADQIVTINDNVKTYSSYNVDDVTDLVISKNMVIASTSEISSDLEWVRFELHNEIVYVDSNDVNVFDSNDTTLFEEKNKPDDSDLN